jgi:hypothetical protein
MSNYPKMLSVAKIFFGQSGRSMENEQQWKYKTLRNFILGTTLSIKRNTAMQKYCGLHCIEESNGKRTTKEYLT